MKNVFLQLSIIGILFIFVPTGMKAQENYGKNSFTHSAYRKTSEKISSGRKV